MDACRQCVETLVTQHGNLVMQSAASNRKLTREGGKKIDKNLHLQKAGITTVHAKLKKPTENSFKSQYLSWDQLSRAGCSLSFSDQDPQSSICCLLFALFLVGCAHWWEPASTQLGLVGEPTESKNKQKKKIQNHSWNCLEQGF